LTGHLRNPKALFDACGVSFLLAASLTMNAFSADKKSEHPLAQVAASRVSQGLRGGVFG